MRPTVAEYRNENWSSRLDSFWIWEILAEGGFCTSLSHIERQNLTMRMQIRRLTRLTNAFSEKWERTTWAALCLHFAYYNICRIHGTLRVTPAMQAGITHRVWELAELLGAMLA